MTTESEKIKEEIEKGCGREIQHSITNVITICKILPPHSVFIEHAENLTKDGFDAITKVVNAPTYEFKLCPICQAHLEGFQAGENSKHKSDLQQELVKWEEVDKHSCCDEETEFFEPCKRCKLVRERINFIKKELENLENG